MCSISARLIYLLLENLKFFCNFFVVFYCFPSMLADVTCVMISASVCLATSLSYFSYRMAAFFLLFWSLFFLSAFFQVAGGRKVGQNVSKWGKIGKSMTWYCLLIHSSQYLSSIMKNRWQRQHCSTGELLIFGADFHCKIVQSPCEQAKCHSNRWEGVWVPIYHICLSSWDCPKGLGFKQTAWLHLVQQRDEERRGFKAKSVLPGSYTTTDIEKMLFNIA